MYVLSSLDSLTALTHSWITVLLPEHQSTRAHSTAEQSREAIDDDESLVIANQHDIYAWYVLVRLLNLIWFFYIRTRYMFKEKK